MCKYMIALLIVSCSLLSVSICQLDEGDPCMVVVPDEYGTCQNARECWHTKEDLKNRIFPTICGFIGMDSIVCCRPQLSPYLIPNRSGANKIDCGHIPASASSVNRTGQKAWDKCIDNLQYVYPCKHFPASNLCEAGNGCGSTKLTRMLMCGHNMARLRSLEPVPQQYFGGSEDADDKEFPHMALLGYGVSAERARWRCSGTVVSENYVLTSGYCATYRKNRSVSFVRVGLLQPSSAIERARLHRVARVVLHPDSEFIDNDIALIRTVTPIILDERVYPACLHTGDTVSEHQMLATGWGLQRRFSNKLQKIWLETYPPDLCTHYMSPTKQLKEDLLKPSQLCAGNPVQNKDPCEMDAGAPIQVFNDAVDCTYNVVGVRSYPRVCGNVGKPAIYTRVSHFLPWIEKVVWPL